MDIIYLIGPRAVGKTTVGRSLADMLHLPFVDTDASLVDHHGRSVAEIVAREGWAAFREYERQTLQRESTAHEESGAVIATGGGMVLAEDNRRWMRACGTVFFLNASVPVLVERLTLEPLDMQRPTLTGKSVNDEVKQVLSERLPLYREAAHHILDADQQLEAVCAAALAFLKHGKGA